MVKRSLRRPAAAAARRVRRPAAAAANVVRRPAAAAAPTLELRLQKVSREAM